MLLLVLPECAARVDEYFWESPKSVRKREDIQHVVAKMAANLNNAVMLKIKGKRTVQDLLKNLNRRYFFDYATHYWYHVSGGKIRLTLKLADNAVLLAAYRKPKLKKRLSADEAQALKIAQDCVKRSIQPTMTRREKVKALHDAIADMCEYDDSDMGNQSCVSVLLHHKGACGAYARTLWLMLRMIDIPCHVIQGHNKNKKDSPHAWTLVQMDDGAWYHVDVCKDDLSEVISYRLFSVTDEVMAEKHDWDRQDYPATP